MGYRLVLELGMDAPPRVTAAIAEYRQEADIIGVFLSQYTVPQDGGRLPTATLYTQYAAWARENGYRPMNSKNFVGELRRRFDVRRDGSAGNVIVGVAHATSIRYADIDEKLPWD